MLIRAWFPVLAPLMFALASLSAQESAHATAAPELVHTIRGLDSALFAANNSCQLAAFEQFFEPNVEFYHDQGGLMLGSAALVSAIRTNICGKTTRQRTVGSDTVFVMHGFGALHMGRHQFYEVGAEAKGPTGEARFVHLWKQEAGAWRITRVYSFDHRPLRD